MKKYIFNLSVFLLLFHFSSRAQISRELLIADYLYNHYAFNEAIDHYEKVTNEVSDPVTLAKLGDCYRLTKNPERAADWYKEAYKQSGCPDYVKLHYAQTLMTLGNYKEALPLLVDYQKSNPKERRIANMIVSCQKEGKIVKDLPDGNVFMQKFNTDGLEFGPAIRKGQLVFTTDTVLCNTTYKKDKWTGTSFYQMYKVDCEENGHCDHAIKKVSDKVNTKYHDGPCSFTQDGSKMYFTRTNHKTQLLTNGPVADQNDVVHLQIMIASEYDADKQDYTKIKRFHFNSHTHSTAHPAISANGQWLVYCSDIPGGSGGTDLYITGIDSRGKWGKPQNLGYALNTEGDEMFPYLDGDSVLYFASNGHVGMGGLDIYKSKWDPTTMTFSDPVNMGKPVNSTYDDMSYVIGLNKSAYFASNRPATKKGDNIYSYTVDEKPPRSTVEKQQNTTDENLVKPLETKIKYHVVILDEKTKKPIENPQLVFIDNEANKIDTFALRTAEVFSTSLQANKTYHVYGIKNNFYGNERYVSTKKIKPGIAVTSIYDTIFMTQLEVGGIYKIDNIYYDYDKATIRDNAKPALERLLEVLAKHPSMTIQLNSHTDCRGSDAYNYKLSNNRAHSVVMYLMEKGISLDRLQYKGYGETMPVNKCGCDSCTEEQHQNNRRTEFQIIAL